MSLAQDFADAFARLFGPMFGKVDKQLDDLKAQVSASNALIATLQAASIADHNTIAGLQAKATADAATIADLKAKLAAAQAPSGHEPDPEPEHEADSPEGYSVSPGGQTITLAGVRSRIGTDKKIYRNDVVQAWSGNVEELFVHNGVLWQFAAWGGEGVTEGFFEARQGAPLVANDPRLPEPPPVVVPPPAPTDGVLRDFKGQQIQDGNWDNPWVPANWWKEIAPWIPANASVVGSDIVLKVDPTGGAAVITTGESNYFSEGTSSVEATCGQPISGGVKSPMYLYGGDDSAGSTIDEVDFELTIYGMQITLHADGEKELEAVNVWTKILPGDYSGRKTYSFKYSAGKKVDFLIDGAVVATVTPKDTLNGLFPKHPLNVRAEIWMSNNAGWLGPRDPKATGSLTLHRYGLAKIA